MKDLQVSQASRLSVNHRLKTQNPWFQDVWDKKKPFEARWDDRDFREGDTIELFEYDPAHPDRITGTREVHGIITYLMEGTSGLEFPVAAGGVCFAFTETRRQEATFSSQT